MKTYHQFNFFKHTYCEFSRCDETIFKKKTIHYTSKKGSKYSYADNGVYRYSNHWRRVANCRWKIEQFADYKNQKCIVGFAKWTDFYPLNKTERYFYLTVDVDLSEIKIHHIKNKNKENFFLFSLVEVQKKTRQIKHLLSTQKWAKYFDEDIIKLRKKLVSELISSHKSFHKIKQQNKS